MTMNASPMVFEHQGFKFVQAATLKRRSHNGGCIAKYSDDYPPIFAFWNGQTATAKQIVRCLGTLKNGTA